MHRSHRLARPSVFVVLVFAALTSRGFAAHETAQRPESSRSFDRTYAVTSAQSLDMEHRHGDVRITTHARPELRVQATIRVSAPTSSVADDLRDRIQIDVVESPSAITIRTRYPERSWWSRRQNLSYSVDYILVVPERMPVAVHNSFGAVSATGLKADATIVNAHGRLTVSDGGARHTLENSFGPIEVARMTADATVTGSNGNVTVATIAGDLSVKNRFGRVNVTAIKGAALVSNSNGQVDLADAGSATVTSSFGAITVRDVHGPLMVGNSNGSVTAGGVKGTARVTTSFGPIDLKDVNADATVENSNGAVHLANVRGAASVRTSFAAAVVSAVTGAVTVTNSNGNVSLRDVGGAAEIRNSFGRVEAQGIKGGVQVTSGNGGVHVADARGPVSVTTSFGPVELRNVEGKVDVRNQNGSIDALLTVRTGACHDVTLTTNFSPIQVHLPAAGYTVNARTSFGKIRSDVPVTATGIIGEGRLSGTIGGGGCALQLTNANGDIQILKVP